MTDSLSTPQQPEPSPNHRLPPSVSGSPREILRDPLTFYRSIAEQYGDVVCYRSAPEPAYLVNHPDYIRHVLVDNNRNYSKATYSNQIFNKVVGEGLLTAEGETWRRQRRMTQPAFHHTRLERLDEMIVEAAEAMLDGWEVSYHAGQPIDIAREMAALTLTVTTRSLFGVNLGDEVREVGEIINRAARFLEKPSHPRLIESVQELNALVDRIIQQRKKDFKDGGELLSSLILARDPETGLGIPDEQLRQQILTLLLAGYETTASALSWTWYLLSQNPAAYARLREEIRDVLNGQRPRYADLDRLVFTRMVVNEGLRLFPPAWTLGRLALGQDEIGGYHIPAGSVIAICTYTVHRHPGFWDEPDRFDPDRFTPENISRRHKYAFIPFGAGPRQCIGNMFGLMEASLVIASIAQRFELRLLPGIQVSPQALFVLRPNRDLMMSLHT